MLGIPTDLIQASIKATSTLAAAIEKLAAATDRQTEALVAEAQRGRSFKSQAGW